MSRYITTSRFKQKAICGEVNLPYGAKCQCDGNCITYNNELICYTTSQNAYDYFSINDDGNGLERGKLIQKIRDILATPDEKHQIRWNKIWDDKSLRKFRRNEEFIDDDTWLWNKDFYCASLLDLYYILNLIKEV